MDEPPKPSLTKDLLSLYGLQSLVASVARTHPVTGDKINKMRKSYEGKVKTFGLAGRNRAVKKEPGKLMGLLDMTSMPEEEWHNQKVVGKELQKGLSGATLAKLERAMHMQPGPVPNNSEWEDLLGFEKAKPLAAVVEPGRKKGSLAEVPTKKVNGLSNGARIDIGRAAATSEVPRPKRAGKKRRYDEHSFEGYGEGFVDDEGDMTMRGGYSSGDGSRKSGSTSKKRRKV